MPVPSLPRVLIAEDQPLTRWAVGHALEPLGYEVHFAGTEHETREKLREPFSVVIAACPLEDQDLRGLLQEVLSGHRHPSSLVVLCETADAPGLHRDLPGAIVVERPFSVLHLASLVQSIREGKAGPGSLQAD